MNSRTGIQCLNVVDVIGLLSQLLPVVVDAIPEQDTRNAVRGIASIRENKLSAGIAGELVLLNVLFNDVTIANIVLLVSTEDTAVRSGVERDMGILGGVRLCSTWSALVLLGTLLTRRWTLNGNRR